MANHLSMSLDARAALQFSARRHTVVLFKDVLSLLETLAEEHDEAMAKLQAALPEEYHAYLTLADYFTEEKADRLRRAVLSRGNDCSRAIQEEIAQYEVSFPGSAAPSQETQS